MALSDRNQKISAGKTLRELIYAGHSFSGHERNCCYLNTRDGRFANVSALTGLNLPDDSRGVGLSDWDYDGDIDLWVVNRSGPQLRFFENQYASREQNRAITLRLQGVKVNRDAIGARVVMQLSDGTNLVRHVQAGNGYLSQSSRTLHFGLGATATVTQAYIDWPGGNRQPLDSLAPGSHYRVVEGAPATFDAQGPLALPRATDSLPPTGGSIRTLLTTPIPYPQLTWEGLDGQARSIPPASSAVSRGSVLVTLWSRTCGPCLQELHEFSVRTQELQQAGISVVALSTDRVSGAVATDQVVSWVAAQKLSMAVGWATPGLLDSLQTLHDGRFDLHRPLPIPSSFLLDADGRLSAIYKGMTSVEQLLADAQQVRQTPSRRREAAMTFAGRWSGAVRTPRLLNEVLDMLELGRVDDAQQFLTNNRQALAADPEISVLYYNLAQRYSQRGDHDTARRYYREALVNDPLLASAHYNLGITEAVTGHLEEALVHFESAATQDPQDGLAWLQWGRTLLRLGKVPQAAHPLETAAQLLPHHAEVSYELALHSVLSGSLETGLSHWRQAVTLAPSRFHQGRERDQFFAAARVGIAQLRQHNRDVTEVERLVTEAEHAPLPPVQSEPDFSK